MECSPFMKENTDSYCESLYLREKIFLNIGFEESSKKYHQGQCAIKGILICI